MESLKDLKPEAVLWLYDIALGLRRGGVEAPDLDARQRGMERSRAALARVRSSLAEDIARAREDRV